VQVRYYKNAPKTLNGWFEYGLKHKDKEFIVYTGKPGEPAQRLTYAETFALADQCRGMLSQLGVKQGDRISICMSNIPEFAVAFIAVAQLGAIATTLNAFWEGEELEFGLTNSMSSILLADDKRVARLLSPVNRLQGLMANGGIKVVIVRPSEEVKKVPGIHDWSALMASAPKVGINNSVTGDMDACIMYTSGTTSGRPKGVVLTQQNFVQSMVCYQLFLDLMKNFRTKEQNAMQRVDLVTSPLFHASALVATFLLSFKDGHKLVMVPRWDAEQAIKIFSEEKVTFFGAMPTMLSDLLASPEFEKNKGKFVVTNIGTGGAAVPSDLIRAAAKALPQINQGLDLSFFAYVA